MMSLDSGSGHVSSPADELDGRETSVDAGSYGGTYANTAPSPGYRGSAPADCVAGTAMEEWVTSGGLPETLADGILAGVGLSGSQAARHVLALHLARFFAEAKRCRENGRVDGERPADPTMTPHSAGPRGTTAVPPFVAPLAAGGAAGNALDVPAHMHGELVRSLGLALLAEMGADGPFSRDAAATLAEALAAGLAASVAAEVAVAVPVGDVEVVRPMARGGLAPHVLRRVTERMTQDLAEELDLPMLAAEARLSPWHFARAFKQSTGEPPHAYRTRLRIEHAKALLAAGEEPVTAIAEAVGYDSAQSLARAFRKLTGRSPSTFRREARA